MKKLLPFIFLLIASKLVSQTATVTAADLDYRKDGNNYLLVLKKGQPVVASLNAFLEKEKLPGATFTGLGAVQNPEVAYYDVNAKHYNYKKFKGSMEVLSLLGNLGWFEGKPIVHPHVNLGAPDFTVHGGHLKEAEVSLLLEIFIIPTQEKITREWSKEFPELRTIKTLKKE
ncbi:PPC domain-containing DNA-binding protein [Foetidibacter luteolus]|uniref:PPC domain-containing DNA-binding protein n=1 Tax=Foetidibacter luteolus TaxID=2608880 RepID=UPI00129B102E|nr:PPC domain-containing DNA-binding protein [Foetidibacter luteolus]